MVLEDLKQLQLVVQSMIFISYVKMHFARSQISCVNPQISYVSLSSLCLLQKILYSEDALPSCLAHHLTCHPTLPTCLPTHPALHSQPNWFRTEALVEAISKKPQVPMEA